MLVTALPENSPMILGRFRQDLITELPRDLYIPPDALLVFLEAFEGPLDLLLYIIKKHNMDILDIPIADVTKQYVAYVELMHDLRLELAGEYLVMAAMLAEIKSRMLLPRAATEAEEEADPRGELIRRLREYELYRAAAEELDQLPRLERDIFISHVVAPDVKAVRPLPEVTLPELIQALQALLQQADLQESHQIELESLSIREKMSCILEQLRQFTYIDFTQCFNLTEGRLGVVITFIAVLELLKQSLIDIVQTSLYAPIHIKAVNYDAEYHGN